MATYLTGDIHGDVAFIDGNHENFPILAKLPTGDGARASCFVMGGAWSIDKYLRTEGVDWWPEEIPSKSVLAHGVETLDGACWSVDYVLTHECPAMMRGALLRSSRFKPVEHRDRLTDFLDEVDARASFERWYCGHYHVDCNVGERHSCLFMGIVPLGVQARLAYG